MRQSLNRVIAGQDLSRAEAAEVMQQMMEGTATPSQIGGLLTALRMKGETVDEITGFAEVMRQKVSKVAHPLRNAVDTCGTGGDGGKTFNVSTATSILVAAMGIPVAKHGNRSVSSKSGSADVLEKLGFTVQMSPQEAEQALREIGICFMFAPLFHQSMRHVMPTRKELGIRTCFNLLGPLTNPAGVKIQLVGVYSQSLTELFASVLKKLGVTRALVVASDDGLDEISISAPTKVSELRDGEVNTYSITPATLGLQSYPLSSVAGGDAARNAEIIRSVFAGKRGGARDIVVANAAAVLYLSDRADSLQEAARLAEQALDAGTAMNKLNQMVAYTGGREHVS